MSSLRRHEGYLLIDHKDSPGVPDSVIHAMAAIGKPTVGSKAGETYESATVTCAHCQAQVVLNPNRQRPRHYCPKCDHYVCDTPACATECRPYLKVVEAAMKPAPLIWLP